MKWKIIFFISAQLYALRISEIYYGGNLFIPDRERYIEIENDTNETIDLREVALVLPRSDTSTTTNSLAQGTFLLFDGEAKTNEWLLPPGERAVVIAEDYNTGGRLLSWGTNTILLKPKSKTSWTYSWNNRLHLMGILYRGVLIKEKNIPSTITTKGYALTYNHDLWQEDIPRPGQTKTIHIFAERVLPIGSPVEIYCESEENLSSLTVESYPDGSRWVYPLQGAPPYHLTLPGSLNHATTWIIRAGNTSHKIRFLDTNTSSPYAGRVIINELLTDPKKDYSGGGWTGEDGGTTINENDDWIELVNCSDQTITTTGWYLEHISSQSRSFRKITLRYESLRGNQPMDTLSPLGIGIWSVENGLSDKASIILYDGHPLWGRRIASLSYGQGDIPSGDASTPFSIQRLPHRAPDGFESWHKQPPTFGTINGTEPFLSYRWSSTNTGTIEIFMSDPLSGTLESVNLQAESEIETKLWTLSGKGGLFWGSFSVGQHSPCDLSVKNGGKNILRFVSGGKTFLWDFVWKKSNYSYPEITDTLACVVYPNPVFLGDKVFITRFPLGTRGVIFDEKGRVVAQFILEKEIFQWKPLKKGVYSLLLSYGGKSLVRKILVQ